MTISGVDADADLSPDAESIHFVLYEFNHFIIPLVFSTCREHIVEANQ